MAFLSQPHLRLTADGLLDVVAKLCAPLDASKYVHAVFGTRHFEARQGGAGREVILDPSTGLLVPRLFPAKRPSKRERPQHIPILSEFLDIDTKQQRR